MAKVKADPHWAWPRLWFLSSGAEQVQAQLGNNRATIEHTEHTEQHTEHTKATRPNRHF